MKDKNWGAVAVIVIQPPGMPCPCVSSSNPHYAWCRAEGGRLAAPPSLLGRMINWSHAYDAAISVRELRDRNP